MPDTKNKSAAAAPKATAKKAASKPASAPSKVPAKAAAPSVPAEQLNGTRTGVVDSDRQDKTRRVVFAYQAMHPKYGKYTRRRTVLHVHDENNTSHVGDVVEVAPCRPLSKSKSWTLVRVVEARSAAAAALASAKQGQ